MIIVERGEDVQTGKHSRMIMSLTTRCLVRSVPIPWYMVLLQSYIHKPSPKRNPNPSKIAQWYLSHPSRLSLVPYSTYLDFHFGSNAACNIPMVNVNTTIIQAVTPNPPWISSFTTDQNAPNAILVRNPTSPSHHSFVQLRPSTKWIPQPRPVPRFGHTSKRSRTFLGIFCKQTPVFSASSG